MMKRCRSILLLICILLTAPVCGSAESSFDAETPVSASPPPELSQRERNWRNDLNYLKREYKRYHKDPFYLRSEEEFEFKIDQLAAKVGQLSDNNIAFEIAAIIAGMGDTHTMVSFPEAVYETFFPVSAMYFGGKLYLAAYLEGYDQFEPYLLQEIVAVNGVDITYLQQKFDSLISPYNTWFSREVFSRYYAIYPAFYEWAGCGYKEGYTFQMVNQNGEVESVEVPVLAWTDFDEDSPWVWPEEIQCLYYLMGGNWADYFEEENGDYIYMSFTELVYLSKQSCRELFETVAGLIEAHPDCGKLVIDLRSHPGGYMSALEYVREYIQLLRSPSIDHIYVLIGGHTASAAMGCVTIFKDSLDAITVGEPTGQFTSFFGRMSAMPRIVLPQSQVSIFLGDCWFEGEHPENEFYDENGKLYEWETTVLPDVFVSQNVEDIRQGKDSVIQWVLNQK